MLQTNLRRGVRGLSETIRRAIHSDPTCEQVTISITGSMSEDQEITLYRYMALMNLLPKTSVYLVPDTHQLVIDRKPLWVTIYMVDEDTQKIYELDVIKTPSGYFRPDIGGGAYLRSAFKHQNLFENERRACLYALGQVLDKVELLSHDLSVANRHAEELQERIAEMVPPEDDEEEDDIDDLF